MLLGETLSNMNLREIRSVKYIPFTVCNSAFNQALQSVWEGILLQMI